VLHCVETRNVTPCLSSCTMLQEHPHVHVIGSDKRHDAKPTATSTAQAASTVMDSLDLACEVRVHESACVRVFV